MGGGVVRTLPDSILLRSSSELNIKCTERTLLQIQQLRRHGCRPGFCG